MRLNEQSDFLGHDGTTFDFALCLTNYKGDSSAYDPKKSYKNPSSITLGTIAKMYHPSFSAEHGCYVLLVASDEPIHDLIVSIVHTVCYRETILVISCASIRISRPSQPEHRGRLVFSVNIANTFNRSPHSLPQQNLSCGDFLITPLRLIL